MSTWKSIIANSNLIQYSNDRSVLIKIPHSKLKFWHPAKCVRTSGKNGYRLTIRYTDDFKFKAFRNGEGKNNFRDVIEECEMSATEIEAAFNADDGEGNES